MVQRNNVAVEVHHGTPASHAENYTGPMSASYNKRENSKAPV